METDESTTSTAAVIHADALRRRGPGDARDGVTLEVRGAELNPLATLGLGMGSAWLSGFNLYATVLTLGLLQRFHLVQLPGDLDFISRGWVVAVAAILYLVEFLADKIPVVDSIWDAIHTLIRVPTGAVLAASAFAHFDPAIRVVALLAGVRSRSALMGPRPGPRPASA
jgi:hypothetical protein